MNLDDTRWLGRAVRPDGPPVQLTYFVTSRCQAKCSHCFYADSLNQPVERELKLDEIERIAASLPRLMWVAFGGGEPFLRADLAEVADVFFRHNRPRVLTAVTNGLTPTRIERIVLDMLARRPPDTFINVSVSLDGLEQTHDRERAVPGNFAKAIDTLHRLRRIRDEHEGFGFSTITTIHGGNAGEMEALERFIDDEVKPDNRGLNLIRGTPLEPTTLDVTLRPYREAVARKRADIVRGTLPLQRWSLGRLNAAKERVMYGEVERVARNATYRAPCQAGRIGAVMYENGDVAACEVLDTKVGNIRDFDYDFRRLWASPAAENLRRMIRERRCRCTWECAVATNILFGPRYWPQLLREWLRGPRATSAPTPDGPAPESVTVLVACRDEAAVIQRKVRNSLGLRFPNPGSCEVLVVDDGSTDDSVAIVEQEIERLERADANGPAPSLRLIANRHAPGKAGAIRSGFEVARGEIVLLTDADVLLEQEALPRALVPFEDPGTGVVCGEQAYCEQLGDGPLTPGDAWSQRSGAIMDPPERSDGIYDWAMRCLRKLDSRLDSTFAVHGQMALFRRSIELDPQSGVAADDVDLALQARRQGYRIRYAEGARFWEERPATAVAATRQGRRHGMALAQALWVNRDMLGRPRYGRFGLVTLPMHWLFLIGQPLALALALTLGLGAGLVHAPVPTAVAVTLLVLLAAGSRQVRSFFTLNGLMLSGIVALVGGASLTDRWDRDRDLGHESAPGAGTE